MVAEYTSDPKSNQPVHTEQDQAEPLDVVLACGHSYVVKVPINRERLVWCSTCGSGTVLRRRQDVVHEYTARPHVGDAP